MAKRKAGARRKSRKAKAVRTKKQIRINTSDVKTPLAAHIRTVQRIVNRHEARLTKAGGRGTVKGKKIAPKLTQAKQMLNALRAAKAAMDATCGCEPQQECPFDM